MHASAWTTTCKRVIDTLIRGALIENLTRNIAKKSAFPVTTVLISKPHIRLFIARRVSVHFHRLQMTDRLKTVCVSTLFS